MNIHIYCLRWHCVMWLINSGTLLILVCAWMSSNQLLLNLDMTQFLWCGSKQNLKEDLAQLADIWLSLVVLTFVRDFGVIVDSEMTFEKHVSQLSQTCFFLLSLAWGHTLPYTIPALQTLTHPFVTCRLDLCNSVFVGASHLLWIFTDCF